MTDKKKEETAPEPEATLECVLVFKTTKQEAKRVYKYIRALNPTQHCAWRSYAQKKEKMRVGNTKFTKPSKQSLQKVQKAISFVAPINFCLSSPSYLGYTTTSVGTLGWK